MREILFRGKRIDNGEWVYGSVATFRNVSNELYTAIIPVVGNENAISKLKRVGPDTVGQYTGLTDKNGKKIFEGDIVNRKGKVASVRYIPSEYVLDYPDNPYPQSGLLNDVFYNRDIEIIGNAIDNPELLEGGEGE